MSSESLPPNREAELSKPDEAGPPAQDAEIDYRSFWSSLLRAVEAEPKGPTTIRGASGASHDVAAVGVDEDRRRVVLISNEVDARSAALAQTDLEAALTPYRVVVGRPVLFDVPRLARRVTQISGRELLDPAALAQFGGDQAAMQAALERI